MDRHLRPPARTDDRAAGGDARDAGHLGAFQRVSYLPRDPPAADAARRDRYAGVVALQIPLPAPDPARPAAVRQDQRAGRGASRNAARVSARTGGSAGRRGRRSAAHRQGVLLGGAARPARHDAHGHRQRLGRRSLPDRHAVPVHGQHGVELGDEPRRHDADADRPRRGDRRIPHPACDLRRCLFFRNGRLCRPGASRHDLSGTVGLHLAARPPDRQRAWAGRRDPPAGVDARPRRAAVPGRAARSRRAAEAARL